MLDDAYEDDIDIVGVNEIAFATEDVTEYELDKEIKE